MKVLKRWVDKFRRELPLLHAGKVVHFEHIDMVILRIDYNSKTGTTTAELQDRKSYERQNRYYA